MFVTFNIQEHSILSILFWGFSLNRHPVWLITIGYVSADKHDAVASVCRLLWEAEHRPLLPLFHPVVEALPS